MEYFVCLQVLPQKDLVKISPSDLTTSLWEQAQKGQLEIWKFISLALKDVHTLQFKQNIY